jgi:hypothetical protein
MPDLLIKLGSMVENYERLMVNNISTKTWFIPKSFVGGGFNGFSTFWGVHGQAAPHIHIVPRIFAPRNRLKAICR